MSLPRQVPISFPKKWGTAYTGSGFLKFGEGVMLSLDGNSDDARARINFSRHGTQWLARSLAKMVVVS